MPQSKPSTRRVVLFVLFLLLTIVALVGVSVSTGHLDLTVGDAYSAILHKFFPDRYEPNWLAEVVVWNLRLPRILLGILAGISLGTAGAIMQWALKNPLASPYTLGISSGAASGASLAILAGAGIVGGKYLIVGAAFVSALIATVIILYISSRRWATPVRVVIIGIMMSICFGTVTTTHVLWRGRGCEGSSLLDGRRPQQIIMARTESNSWHDCALCYSSAPADLFAITLRCERQAYQNLCNGCCESSYRNHGLLHRNDRIHRAIGTPHLSSGYRR